VIAIGALPKPADLGGSHHREGIASLQEAHCGLPARPLRSR